jgi:hypothetical protein
MHRNHIRFIAALAAVALLALGVAGTASAKKKLKPLKPNSVTSITIKDGEVNTNDLAGAAVTATQLAAQSVSTSALEDDAVIGAKVQDDSLTGDDVNESTFKYGCGGNVAGIRVSQVAGSGFCAFAVLGENKTWAGASALCKQKLPASGLPSSDELYLAVTGSDDQNPLRDVVAAFTSDLVGGANPAALLTFSNGNFTSSTVGTLSLTLSQHVCVFQPSDRNG